MIIISCILIIGSFALEVALWVIANWADFWSGFADYDVAAVTTDPNSFAVAGEYFFVFDAS